MRHELDAQNIPSSRNIDHGTGLLVDVLGAKGNVLGRWRHDLVETRIVVGRRIEPLDPGIGLAERYQQARTGYRGSALWTQIQVGAGCERDLAKGCNEHPVLVNLIRGEGNLTACGQCGCRSMSVTLDGDHPTLNPCGVARSRIGLIGHLHAELRLRGRVDLRRHQVDIGLACQRADQSSPGGRTR